MTGPGMMAVSRPCAAAIDEIMNAIVETAAATADLVSVYSDDMNDGGDHQQAQEGNVHHVPE